MSTFLRQAAVASLLGIGIHSAASAGPSVSAKVVYAGLYGDGRLFVALDTQIQEPGCSQVRFDVASSHPQLKNWLAIALTAAATGRTVKVQTSGCFGTLPTMTQNDSSFFYMSAQD